MKLTENEKMLDAMRAALRGMSAPIGKACVVAAIAACFGLTLYGVAKAEAMGAGTWATMAAIGAMGVFMAAFLRSAAAEREQRDREQAAAEKAAGRTPREDRAAA